MLALSTVLMTSHGAFYDTFAGPPAGVNVIPGKGCGTSKPFKYLAKVPESEEERECAVITDDKAWKAFQDAKPSMPH